MTDIPAHATRVFKGLLCDIYQWDQTLFDGRVTTFEAIKRPDLAFVIPIKDNHVYYAYQEQPNRAPYISLFGGRVEDGETSLQAAQRELREESGLVSDDWVLLREHRYTHHVKQTVSFYLARQCRMDVASPDHGGEKIEVRSCLLEDFINTVIADTTFTEHELKREIFSALNHDAATALIHDMLTKI